MHVLMLCKKFEIFPIKIGVALKFGQRPCTRKSGCCSAFAFLMKSGKDPVLKYQKLLIENSQFILHFLIQIYYVV